MGGGASRLLSWREQEPQDAKATSRIPVSPALGVAGLFLVPRAIAVLAALLLGYETLVAMLFVGETRYRVPWDFLIGLLAARVLVALWQRVGERVQVGRAPAPAKDR